MASVKPEVYVASFYFPDLAERTQKALPDVKVTKIELPTSATDVSDNDLNLLKDNAEALFCDTTFTRYCISGWKKLKWIQAKGAGVNSLMCLIDKNNPPNFVLTRSTSNSILIGEYVMMYILALERNLLQVHQAQNNKQWKQYELSCPRLLSRLTICIIGVGHMGKEVARRCKQLGMTVHGVTRTQQTPEQQCPHVDRYWVTAQLQEALVECDYICCALPGTPDTDNILSGEVLSVCKDKKPTLISVGRGNIIDEQSIIQAIKDGWLGGAVLDVFPIEPLPVDSPLWTLPNVIITPHLSGYCRDPSLIDRYVETFVDNYHRFCAGEILLNVVDYQKGY